MSHLPPVPVANQTPFPIEELPHVPSDSATASSVASTLDRGLATAKAAISPLAEKATTFARARPWATAALVGTVALAVYNTLRGRRA